MVFHCGTPTIACRPCGWYRWGVIITMTAEKLTSYACAVLLIVSSIALAFIQVFDLKDIANGTLMYIAQAFLLAGSIFGLDYYINKITHVLKK